MQYLSNIIFSLNKVYDFVCARKGRKVSIVFFILLLCSLLLQADEFQLNQEDLKLSKKELSEKAQQAFSNGDTKEAFMLLNLVVYNADEIRPRNVADAKSAAEAYLLMGDIHSGKNKTESQFIDHGKAYSCYSHAERIARKFGLKYMLPKALMGLGSQCQIFLSIEDSPVLNDTFVNVMRRGLGYAIEFNDAETASNIVKILAERSFPKGRGDEIKEDLNKYFNYIDSHKIDNHPSRHVVGICRMLQALYSGDFEKALGINTQMREDKENNDANLIDILSIRSDILMQMGKPEEALAQFDSVAAIAKRTGNKWFLMQVFDIQSKAYANYGNKERADSARVAYLELKEEFLKDKGLTQVKDLNFMEAVDNLKLQQQKILLKSHYTKIGLIAISIVAIIFACMIFTLFKAHRKLKEKNRCIYKEYQRYLKTGRASGQLVLEPLESEAEVVDREVESADSLSGDEKESAIEVVDTQSVNLRQVTLDPFQSDEILKKINKVFNETKIPFSHKFQLRDLAREIGESIRATSETINDRCGCNFSTLLAQHRINEACRRINESESFRKLTIEAMAESVGIQSRSYFSITFKKVVGLNPSEYIKQATINN